MNPYTRLGTNVGTNDALSLGARMSAWHDAMVAHERRLRTAPSNDTCHDECPHAEANVLWAEAVVTFGARARELTFLRSRAQQSRRPGSSDREAAAYMGAAGEV
jgi:hypothetical protein